jgi:hypothetical protein
MHALLPDSTWLHLVFGALENNNFLMSSKRDYKSEFGPKKQK